MPDSLLIRETLGPVTRLTLNAPGSFNALSDAMLAALKSTFTALASDPSTRVIILRGAGKAFARAMICAKCRPPDPPPTRALTISGICSPAAPR